MTDLQLYDSFAEVAGLNRKDAWNKKRIIAEYAECEISQCQHTEWWYCNFIGVRFFGELRFRAWVTGKKELYEVIPVRVVNSKIYYGRALDAKDISIV